MSDTDGFGMRKKTLAQNAAIHAGAGTAKSRALTKKSYSGHYQEGRGGRIIQLSQSRAKKLGMDTN